MAAFKSRDNTAMDEDLDLRHPPRANEKAEREAAIAEGVADADAGRLIPIEDVKGMLAKWITRS